MSRSPHPIIAGMLLALAGCGGCQKPEDRVVVYSAQDEDFAVRVFGDFEKETGLAVAPKFDTEAQKTVALLEGLKREADRPRCDVHWNNEILGTIRLAREGTYEPYESPQAAAFPDWSRPKDRAWQAFAERARVLIVNTALVPEADRPRSVLDLTDPKWKGKVAMAKPLFGTTSTHAACLFEVLGPEAAMGFFRGLKANGVQVVAGNKQAATAVSAGTAAVGLTDTDDAVIELLAGQPVAIVFPDAAGHPQHPRLGTLYVPNTLAVVKGAPNPDGARKLIDYLLRPETEKRLAEGGGYQFPVNPAVKLGPHPALKTRHEVKRMDVDFETAADLWPRSQKFLEGEFTR
jgi:iron(III) transport system substrate-binding protein